MKVIQGGPRIAFLLFFLSHIPITLLIDGQGLLSSWYPQLLRDVVQWYSQCFGDVLMSHAPSMDTAWFSSIILVELLFQLPFFFVASWMLWEHPGDGGSKIQHLQSCAAADNYPDWFRTASLIYGSHVTTTLVPILGTFVTSPEMSLGQKVATISST